MDVSSLVHSKIKIDMPTGDVEVLVDNVEVLNEASQNLPFSTADLSVPVGHELQMEYRPLYLRKSSTQDIIRLRSKVAMAARNYLETLHGFVDIETPTLFKRTPEGAREFIVPTRSPGKFYALAQSPQQFKQLLMVGGFDRYYQFARCYRDEDMKSDRQPEFTQIDLEMAFVTQEDIITLTEGLVAHIFANVLPSRPQPQIPFPRLTHAKAMETYNSDKPKIGEEEFNFLWVVDFPLFTRCPSTGMLESSHHPFTAPQPDDVTLVSTSPEKVRGLHYDLVCNGVELGGGSIRIHDAVLQEYILSNILKVKDIGVFSHLLKGLRMGCPPHGGIALGFDRLIAILCGGIPLTDTIAFPKAAHGNDLMCKAPSSLPQDVLDMYHIRVKKEDS
ncbi:aspartate--tRNA ligase, mitochondrial-like isoform X2 [Dysidea avara]|uniref:aspartate--tRNA ligase, mitochondrial-like isoform X2 n=1 Tax=Dysidea avara TaxID=196820 RepID=UPI00332B48C2